MVQPADKRLVTEAKLGTELAPILAEITEQDGELSAQGGRVAVLEADKYVKPAMAATADFNTYNTAGVVTVASSTNKTNLPPGVAIGGTLYTEVTGANVVQHYVTADAMPRTFSRRYSSSAWGTWRVGTWNGGLVSTGTDLNTVTTFGVYGIQSTTHPNQPVPVIGTIEVLPASGNYTQRYTTSELRPRVFYRRWSGTAWSAWNVNTWDYGLLTIGTDFDSVQTIGVYGIQSISHPNQPAPMIGTLEVLPASGIWVQRYTTSELIPRVFHRRYYVSAWQGWSELGTSGGSGGGVEAETSYATPVRAAITAAALTETTRSSSDIMSSMNKDRTKGWNANGNTLKETRDEGATWTTIRTFTGEVIEAVVPLDNGELLVEANDAATSMRRIYVSEGYGTPGVTWPVKITGSATSVKFTPGWSLYAHENIVLANEYGPKAGMTWAGGAEVIGSGLNARYLHLSLDYGKTWTQIFDLNAWLTAKGLSTDGQHPHGVAWDKYWDRIWYSFGDNNGGSASHGILYSDDLGATWQEAYFYSGPNAPHQVVGILPMPKCILFAGDVNPSGLVRINRSEGKAKSGHYSPEIAFDSTAAGTHLCQAVTRITRPGDDAPAFFGFCAEIVSAPSFIIATYDGYTITEVWRDSVSQSAGMGMRTIVGPTLRGNLIASSNDLKVASNWSQLKGKAPGY